MDILILPLIVIPLCLCAYRSMWVQGELHVAELGQGEILFNKFPAPWEMMFKGWWIFDIKDWYMWYRRNVAGQTCFVWCDQCRNEMTTGTSFISDTDEADGNHVRYKCERCGKEHDFNFAIAPVPIPWSELTPKPPDHQG